MKPEIRVGILIAGWCLWVAQFALFRQKGEKAVRVLPAARWGMVLNGVGFALAYAHTPAVWRSPLEVWRAVLGAVLMLAGAVLANAAIRHLGKQWRFDAGVIADHKLIRTGPYGLVRHPIYLSMFLMLLGVLALVGTMPGIPLAILLFTLGTEIRRRVEDRLLEEQFGNTFREWRDRVPAWLPGIF